MHAFEPHNQSFQFIPLIVISEACTTAWSTANWPWCHGSRCHHWPGQGLLEWTTPWAFCWMAEAPEAIYNQPISFSPRVHTHRSGLEELEERDWYLCHDLNAAETHFIHRSFLSPSPDPFPALCLPSAPRFLLRFFLPRFFALPRSLSLSFSIFALRREDVVWVMVRP